ncbi:MAG: thymidine phosphorylase, partial [Ignavibacteriales bacterium]|nr:thymidine phosphorylase [Ignavibacteriales bacterium]
LRGSRGNSDLSSDLMEVTFVLAGAMLMLGKRAKNIDEGISFAKQSIKDGSAYKKFLDLVRVQGGDVSAIENLERYPLSKHSIEVKASEDGYIAEIDSLELGLTSIELGAGRARIDDVIDPKAGVVLKKKVGDTVGINDTVAVFYTDKETVLHAAKDRIAKALRVQSTPPKKTPMIVSYIDKNGVKEWK